MLDWSQIIHYRDQIHERYRKIWNIPLIKRRFSLIDRNILPGMRLLDVGAGERGMGEKIAKKYDEVIYKSMDIDRRLHHDYYSLDDIDEQFDLVLLLDVIEHLELEEGVEMLQRINELLVDGGNLIINTPNIFNPNRFWLDATHKVAYSYEELGGILLSQGFDVLEIYRTYNDSFPKYFLRLALYYPLHRILNVDFAKSILILACKKKTNA
jgi:2-polyprenyl-3-methyl-5-hydroxy-6-metoxy-1,4-benzoquinol methylase